MKGELDSWGIRKYTDEELIKILRNDWACEEAMTVSITEVLARILKKLQKHKSRRINKDGRS